MKQSPDFSEEAVPSYHGQENSEEFKRFLADKVMTYTAMRGNYGEHTDPLPLISSSALALALELVFPMPTQRNDAKSHSRGASIRHAIGFSLNDRVNGGSHAYTDANKLLELERVDGRLAIAINILGMMHEEGLNDDVFETASNAVFYLADDADFLTS